MKLWLDDVRKKPRDYDIHALNVTEAYPWILSGKVTHISFDHDLGSELTGYDLAKIIEELAYEKKIPAIKWRVHSANPVGKKNIEACMKKAEKFWLD